MLPDLIRQNYEVHEWKHACAILKEDFPDEWNDILSVLTAFRLNKSWITNPGGRKSKVSEFIDNYLYDRGWVEKEFHTQMVVDQNTMDTPTHKVDCFRKLLFDLRAISVGVIITRYDDLQSLFNELGRGSSYGASTTHMSKLLPRIEGGSGAGCPLLVFGISKLLYMEDE